MNQDELNRHLLLTSDIAYYLELYGREATRAAPTRAFLETHASRVLKRAAELYCLARQPLAPNEGLAAGGTACEASAATARPASPPAQSQRSYGAGCQPAVAAACVAATPTPGHEHDVVTTYCERCCVSYPGGAATCDWCARPTQPRLPLLGAQILELWERRARAHR